MKYEYQNNKLVVSGIELSDNEIQAGQKWISDTNREIEIIEIKTNFVYFHHLNSKTKPFDFHISDFKKIYSKIVIENVSEMLTVENLIQIVREKECRNELIEKLSTFFDDVDMISLCDKMKENNRSEYNKFQESFLETLELETDYKVLKIDTLEKQYQFESIQEQFKF